jgi:hypothetical protein
MKFFLPDPNKDEWGQRADELQARERYAQEIKKLLKKYDKSHNGVLDEKEGLQFLSDYYEFEAETSGTSPVHLLTGEPMSDPIEWAEQAFRFLDKNNDHVLEFQELLGDFYTMCKEANLAQEGSEAVVKEWIATLLSNDITAIAQLVKTDKTVLDREIPLKYVTQVPDDTGMCSVLGAVLQKDLRNLDCKVLELMAEVGIKRDPLLNINQWKAANSWNAVGIRSLNPIPQKMTPVGIVLGFMLRSEDPIVRLDVLETLLKKVGSRGDTQCSEYECSSSFNEQFGFSGTVKRNALCEVVQLYGRGVREWETVLDMIMDRRLYYKVNVNYGEDHFHGSKSRLADYTPLALCAKEHLASGKFEMFDKLISVYNASLKYPISHVRYEKGLEQDLQSIYIKTTLQFVRLLHDDTPDAMDEAKRNYQKIIGRLEKEEEEDADEDSEE